ncbi:MAG TPA: heavy metal sensor histidine kinase [Rhodocyclaceae bacterium]
MSKPARRPSITFRLAALFVVAAAAVLLGFGVFIMRATDAHFAEMDLHDLRAKLELTRHELAKVHAPSDLPNLAEQLDDVLVGQDGSSIAVLGPQAETIFATRGAAFPAPLLQQRALGADRPLVWDADGRRYRGIAATVPFGSAAMPPAGVAIALDISHHRDFLAAFERTLWLSVAGGIVLMAVLGWWIARRGIRPVKEMAGVVNRITAQRLHERVPADTAPIELAGLAQSFNDLLVRLEDSFTRLSDFSSDIAHELRTPVNTLMTQAQVALSKERSAAEYREVLHSCLEEYERLAHMISDMLFLAKADNGLVVPNAETLDLGDEARRVAEFFEAYAESAGVRLRAEGSGEVAGDRLMLQRAIGNLVSNAIAHAPSDGEVAITVAGDADHVLLQVANAGAALADPERVFERFYREDPARAREGGEGTGLGLAITRSIVVAHGGSISARSAQGRTVFEVVLPRPGR